MPRPDPPLIRHSPSLRLIVVRERWAPDKRSALAAKRVAHEVAAGEGEHGGGAAGEGGDGRRAEGVGGEGGDDGPGDGRQRAGGGGPGDFRGDGAGGDISGDCASGELRIRRSRRVWLWVCHVGPVVVVGLHLRDGLSGGEV